MGFLMNNRTVISKSCRNRFDNIQTENKANVKEWRNGTDPQEPSTLIGSFLEVIRSTSVSNGRNTKAIIRREITVIGKQDGLMIRFLFLRELKLFS